jgi:UDP-N-acetylglucosamine/UDP-N-acetylgalactosamine 4-epimerase
MTFIPPYVEQLRGERYKWLVTGAAGFIGSHLVESLLRLQQDVVGLDNLSRGHRSNIQQVEAAVGPRLAKRHRFVVANICDMDACRAACKDVDFVLHHAALGSVPGSIADPVGWNESNVTGFVNMLTAARDAGVSRFIYAASSSTYGDSVKLPKVEEEIGRPLSPYAVTKYVNELYAEVFARCYGVQCIGFRYFNVFGPRQDPSGAYAAVIPRWVRSLLTGEQVEIYGDGETSRDFCYVQNVVQTNLLAALTQRTEALNQVYNIAVGDRTSLNQLFTLMRDLLAAQGIPVQDARPTYQEFRPGDVRHSEANIWKAKQLLGYQPTHDLSAGLAEALPWYVDQHQSMPPAKVRRVSSSARL